MYKDGDKTYEKEQDAEARRKLEDSIKSVQAGAGSPDSSAVLDPTVLNKGSQLNFQNRKGTEQSTLILILSVIYLGLAVASLVWVNKFYFYTGRYVMDGFNPFKRKPSYLVPIWFHLPDQLPFGDWLDDFYFSCITISCFWLIDFFFCLGTYFLHGNGFHQLFIFSLLVTIYTQQRLFNSLNTLDSQLISDLAAKVRHHIEQSYEVVAINDVIATLNLMMILGDCCGFSGPEDFHNVELTVDVEAGVNPYPDIVVESNSPTWLKDFHIPVPNMTTNGTLLLPPACCPDQVFSPRNLQFRLTAVYRCADRDTDQGKNIKGCLPKFWERIVQQSILIPAMFIILIFELLQVLLIIKIIHNRSAVDETTALDDQSGSFTSSSKSNSSEEYYSGSSE